MAAADEDDPFELISKGNECEASSNHWRSADYYGSASISLRRHADDLSAQIRASGNGSDDGRDEDRREKRRVVSLFRAQSLEYLYKARHCLIEAMRFENEQDRARTREVARTGSGSLDPLCTLITAEESERRAITFERVFSCADEVETSAGAKTDESTSSAPKDTAGKEEISMNHSKPDPDLTTDATGERIDDRQQSIESRLKDLDSSLLPKVPPPFISGSRTSDNGGGGDRLEEIKRGLGRLGVTLPDSTAKSDLIPERLSAEDQVKLIIQQANDEVRVERGEHTGGGDEGTNDNVVDARDADPDDDYIDENNSMFDDFEDDDYDIDALLSKAENLAAIAGVHKTDGGGKFSSELIQIRRAQALLLEARLCLEMVQAKSSNEQKVTKAAVEEEKDDTAGSGSDDDSEEESDKASEVAVRKKAKELIISAQDSMKEILKSWK